MKPFRKTGNQVFTVIVNIGHFPCSWIRIHISRTVKSKQIHADPDTTFHFIADPDPTCDFDADPDPTFHLAADPDPDFSCQIKAQNLKKVPVLKQAQIPYILNCQQLTDADPDPDPAFTFIADPAPDPTFQFDADPDPQHWLL